MPFPIPVTFFKAGTTTTTTTTTTTVAVKIILTGLNGASGTGKIETSSNGTSWSLQNVISMSCAGGQEATGSIYGGAYAPSLGLYVLTFAGGSVVTSTTATTSSWTLRSTPFTNCAGGGFTHRVAWAPSLSLFCATFDNSGNINSSPDGINWTSRTGAGSANNALALCSAKNADAGVDSPDDTASIAAAVFAKFAACSIGFVPIMSLLILL